MGRFGVGGRIRRQREALRKAVNQIGATRRQESLLGLRQVLVGLSG